MSKPEQQLAVRKCVVWYSFGLTSKPGTMAQGRIIIEGVADIRTEEGLLAVERLITETMLKANPDVANVQVTNWRSLEG